jgi:hypothetical protein
MVQKSKSSKSKYANSYITREYLWSEQNRMVEQDPFRRRNKLARKGSMAKREAREAREEMLGW